MKIQLYGWIFIYDNTISNIEFSEKFELLSWRVWFYRFVAVEYLYVAKLLVGYAENTYVAVFRQE